MKYIGVITQLLIIDPNFQRRDIQVEAYCVWSVVTGVVSYVLVIIFWRMRDDRGGFIVG